MLDLILSQGQMKHKQSSTGRSTGWTFLGSSKPHRALQHGEEYRAFVRFFFPLLDPAGFEAILGDFHLRRVTEL